MRERTEKGKGVNGGIRDEWEKEVNGGRSELGKG